MNISWWLIKLIYFPLLLIVNFCCVHFEFTIINHNNRFICNSNRTCCFFISFYAPLWSTFSWLQIITRLSMVCGHNGAIDGGRKTKEGRTGTRDTIALTDVADLRGHSNFCSGKHFINVGVHISLWRSTAIIWVCRMPFLWGKIASV